MKSEHHRYSEGQPNRALSAREVEFEFSGATGLILGLLVVLTVALTLALFIFIGLTSVALVATFLSLLAFFAVFADRLAAFCVGIWSKAKRGRITKYRKPNQLARELKRPK